MKRIRRDVEKIIFTTTDKTLMDKYELLHMTGIRHEDIYRAGLVAIGQEQLTQNNVA